MHKIVFFELLQDKLMIIFDPLLYHDSLSLDFADFIINLFEDIKFFAPVIDNTF